MKIIISSNRDNAVHRQSLESLQLTSSVGALPHDYAMHGAICTSEFVIFGDIDP